MERQIKELYKPLFLYIKKRVNNQEDAEDLTQEVFYKLSKSTKKDIVNVQSWIYTIAKNTIIDYYRKKKRYTEDVEEIAFTKEEDKESAVEELSRCVLFFINELPEEYRTLMILSEIEGARQKEIAESLDMNYVTVRSKIQRGRKKLKEMFSDCCTIMQGGEGRILDYKLNHDNCCDE